MLTLGRIVTPLRISRGRNFIRGPWHVVPALTPAGNRYTPTECGLMLPSFDVERDAHGARSGPRCGDCFA